jgi:hypothetical protein
MTILIFLIILQYMISYILKYDKYKFNKKHYSKESLK